MFFFFGRRCARFASLFFILPLVCFLPRNQPTAVQIGNVFAQLSAACHAVAWASPHNDVTNVRAGHQHNTNQTPSNRPRLPQHPSLPVFLVFFRAWPTTTAVTNNNQQPNTRAAGWSFPKAIPSTKQARLPASKTAHASTLAHNFEPTLGLSTASPSFLSLSLSTITHTPAHTHTHTALLCFELLACLLACSVSCASCVIKQSWLSVLASLPPPPFPL